MRGNPDSCHALLTVTFTREETVEQGFKSKDPGAVL